MNRTGTAAAGDAYWYDLRCIARTCIYIFGRIAEIQVGKKGRRKSIN
jgi:hypothetical protein